MVLSKRDRKNRKSLYGCASRRKNCVDVCVATLDLTSSEEIIKLLEPRSDSSKKTNYTRNNPGFARSSELDGVKGMKTLDFGSKSLYSRCCCNLFFVGVR